MVNTERSSHYGIWEYNKEGIKRIRRWSITIIRTVIKIQNFKIRTQLHRNMETLLRRIYGTMNIQFFNDPKKCQWDTISFFRLALPARVCADFFDPINRIVFFFIYSGDLGTWNLFEIMEKEHVARFIRKCTQF